MLYLALPPTPPPIFITLTPQEVAGEALQGKSFLNNQPKTASSQNNGNARAASAQPLGCQLSEAKTQKSDLVNSLLSKVLKASTVSIAANNNCVYVNQKNESTIPKIQTKVDKQKSGNFSSVSVSSDKKISSSTDDEGINTEIGRHQQSNVADASSSEQQLNSQVKSLDNKNPLGKIIATVQELISISLYASINGTVGTEVTQNNKIDEINSQKVTDTNPNSSISLDSSNAKPNANSTDTNSGLISVVSANTSTQKILAVVQELITASIYASLNSTIQLDDSKSAELKLTPPKQLASDSKKSAVATNIPELKPNLNNTVNQTSDSKQSLVAALKNSINQNSNNVVSKESTLELAQVPEAPFLVGVLINGKEVGTIDVLIQNNILFIPIESFAQIAGFTVEQNGKLLKAKTPLGTVNLQPDDLIQINGIVYISKQAVQEQLKINLELNTADINLLVDLPWRGGGQARPIAQLKPEALPPSSTFSTLKQELNILTYSGNTDIRSSSLLGGRLAGGSWRVRLDNDFENSPNFTEYFFYKRSGQFRYQAGKQQLGLHPLFDGISLTGLQFGYTNLPADSFSSSYSANELLPRRSKPIQSFRGSAPPASFVQLRVGGSIVAQQQVGFGGQYDFADVSLPVGQSQEVEVLIFDRSNLRVPREIRTVRVSASDLLLPAGGNVQLGGLGLTGNLVQTSLLGDSRFKFENEGQFAGFYQLRQGLSNNLTFETGIQALPDTFQAQAGLVWRLANPAILSASVGSSNDKIGYSTNLDIRLNRLEINANSQSLPQRYFSGARNSKEYFNHSIELKYSFGNRLDLGFIARNRQDETNSANYILPTFSARPFSSLFLSGRPDVDGQYLFNAFYQPNWSTRFSFSTYGDTYVSDLSYKFNNNYQLSFGSEFGGNDAARYTARVGHTPNDFRAFSWNVGLGLTSDGEIGPVAGASMQVLPGLLGRIEYQGIPSRSRSFLGGLGDDRLSFSLVSDLSFGGGRVAPAWTGGVNKERGAIAGKLVAQGVKQRFDMSGSNVRVYNNRNQLVGSASTDSSGSFMVGNLPEGNYIVELEPDGLPVELSLAKTSMVAQVANSAVTRLDFPVRAEYGLAGKVTDVAGQAISQVRVELLNPQGARVISAMTDQFGLYRLDGVPVGKYVLRISPQDLPNPSDALPKRQVEISSEFIYNQNLQLPISAAAKKKQ